MKTTLLIFLFFVISPIFLSAQITSPVIRANFGVDADLRANFFNGVLQAGNDDWFNNGTAGSGQFIIDTAGAAALVAQYLSNTSSRRLPFYRTMRYPKYTVVNNRLLLDAVMVRDYHGDDSTVFGSGSSKNGDSPADWACPVSQGIPDKNDILDMFTHVRRAGPNPTDSLWMFGGLSLDNTTGNRYFDFEMYQTDIYYDRTTRQFYGYGPDAGHTSWQFDAAGNIISAGDIIFTAQYQSASLTAVEARIWVHNSALAMTPAAFDWSGQFDGAYSGAVYGYASIQPKSAGTYYTGLQCGNNTWGGPFGIILQNDSYVTTYEAKQFVEFSVNLTKLGLDPVSLLGSNSCGMAFRRVLVKTRSSESFTSELKDFVGPFDFFLAPRVEVGTDIPTICDTGSISTIYITNPVPTSVYNWSTNDGNIVGSPTGTSINVDRPGTYFVTQYLQAGCTAYASDTITIGRFENCGVLAGNLFNLRTALNNGKVKLIWTVLDNRGIDYFDIERSTDNINFTAMGRVTALPSLQTIAEYNYSDNISGLGVRNVFYRILLKFTGNGFQYSSTVRIPLQMPQNNSVNIKPNPVSRAFKLQVVSGEETAVNIQIFNLAGEIQAFIPAMVQKGINEFTLEHLSHKPNGVYQAMITMGAETFTRKIIVAH